MNHSLAPILGGCWPGWELCRVLETGPPKSPTRAYFGLRERFILRGRNRKSKFSIFMLHKIRAMHFHDMVFTHKVYLLHKWPPAASADSHITFCTTFAETAQTSEVQNVVPVEEMTESRGLLVAKILLRDASLVLNICKLFFLFSPPSQFLSPPTHPFTRSATTDSVQGSDRHGGVYKEMAYTMSTVRFPGD